MGIFSWMVPLSEFSVRRGNRIGFLEKGASASTLLSDDKGEAGGGLNGAESCEHVRFPLQILLVQMRRPCIPSPPGGPLVLPGA
jgi:hypothetical protein